ncbi:MAG TPA: hypothetical protein VLW54_08880 [Candidatus Acidoferrales bacterium]|nr:hypothetical protein [Candidatus Acidoferrales bacterium]
MRYRTAILGAALLVAISALAGQDETDPASFYIDSQFQEALGELPRLAWFLPDGTVAAQYRAQDIVLYSRWDRPQAAHWKASLTPEQIAGLRKNQIVACDVTDKGEPPELSTYTALAHPAGLNPQVLSTRNRFPGLETGFQQAPLKGRAAEDVWKAMEAAKEPRRGVILRRQGGTFAYALAAIYGGAHQEVTRRALFLLTQDGKIVAAHVENIRGEWCDGCETPKYEDGIERVYDVENVFTAPSFAYPLLMLDSSTMEGRSITLVTFTPSREYSRHLFYEYVKDCSQ